MIPIKLPKEEKEVLIDALQAHLEMDHGITLGRMGSEQLVDTMLQQLAVPVYNLALEDARKTLLEKMASLEDELYAMRKSSAQRRS